MRSFLVHEARLLDDGRFEEWLGLFTADAWYWVPSQPDQANPRDMVSLIYDDRRLLETRVRRLASPRIYSQEPRSRTTRIVANVTIEEQSDDRARAWFAPSSSCWNIAAMPRQPTAVRCFIDWLRPTPAFALPGNGSISSTATPCWTGS